MSNLKTFFTYIKRDSNGDIDEFIIEMKVVKDEKLRFGCSIPLKSKKSGNSRW